MQKPSALKIILCSLLALLVIMGAEIGGYMVENSTNLFDTVVGSIVKIACRAFEILSLTLTILAISIKNQNN